MNTQARRNFGVGDGMILIAATAIGLAGDRCLFEDFQTGQGPRAWPPHGTPDFQSVLELSVFLGLMWSPCLIVWTLACYACAVRGLDGDDLRVSLGRWPALSPAWRSLLRSWLTSVCW